MLLQLLPVLTTESTAHVACVQLALQLLVSMYHERDSSFFQPYVAGLALKWLLTALEKDPEGAHSI